MHASSNSNCKGRQALEHSADDEGSTFFPRFIVETPVESERLLSTLSPFVINKYLQANVGTLNSVRKLQSGHLLVETDSRLYSQKLLALSALADVAVKAEPHRTLNSCKGVIRCAELKHSTTEGIIEELQPQGVTDCINISVRTTSGTRKNTNTYILTFNGFLPPVNKNWLPQCQS